MLYLALLLPPLLFFFFFGIYSFILYFACSFRSTTTRLACLLFASVYLSTIIAAAVCTALLCIVPPNSLELFLPPVPPFRRGGGWRMGWMWRIGRGVVVPLLVCACVFCVFPFVRCFPIACGSIYSFFCVFFPFSSRVRFTYFPDLVKS